MIKHVTCARTLLRFLFAVCKSFYLQRAKVFTCSVQKFLFAASVQTFLFAACKSFYLQRAKVFTCSVHLLFDDTGIQDYYYLLHDILIVCKFHIINSIFTALQRFYLMKVLSLLGHRTMECQEFHH